MFCIDAAPDTLRHKTLPDLGYKVGKEASNQAQIDNRNKHMSTNTPHESRHDGAVQSEVRPAAGRGHIKYRRLFAILAFVAGGFAAEISAPLQCTLIHASRPYQKRRKV
jgi:hypothetical protein